MKNKQYFVFWFKIKTAVRNHPIRVFAGGGFLFLPKK
jgi:hypothetical protein